jgi:excisionase family DNA binding protein
MLCVVPKDDEEPEGVGGADWLGTTQAAAYIGVVPRTLYRLIDEDKIPAFKLGRVIRLRRSDLDAFLESTRVRPGDLSKLYPPPKPGGSRD